MKSFKFKIYYSSAESPPQGSRLFLSLISATRELWKSQTNLPITSEKSLRFPPAEELWHLWIPSNAPGAQLTPWKLGIAYVWATTGAIDQEIWPGNITAHVYDSHNGALTTYLGRLVVLNSARNNLVDSAPIQDDGLIRDTTRNDTVISSGTSPQPAAKAGNIMTQQNSAILEKSYIDTISMIFHVVVSYSDHERVIDAWSPVRIARYTSNYDTSIESRIRLFHSPQWEDLTWDMIALIIIRLTTDVASHRDWPTPRWSRIGLEGHTPWAEVWVGPKTSPLPPIMGTDAVTATS